MELSRKFIAKKDTKREIDAIQFYKEYCEQMTKNNKALFKGINIDFQNGEGYNFRIPELRNIKFQNCGLAYARLGKFTGYQKNYEHGKDRKGINISNVEFNTCWLYDFSLGDSLLDNVVFDGCDIDNNSMIGECSLNQVTMNNVLFDVRDKDFFMNCVLTKCNFLINSKTNYKCDEKSGKVFADVENFPLNEKDKFFKDCLFNECSFSSEKNTYKKLTHTKQFTDNKTQDTISTNDK